MDYNFPILKNSIMNISFHEGLKIVYKIYIGFRILLTDFGAPLFSKPARELSQW